MSDMQHAMDNAAAWFGSIKEMMEHLAVQIAADDSQSDEETARETILESVLSVQVRDGWKQVGAESEGAKEYEILLTTGGPALRIYGELGAFGQPESAELQAQDWGTPWTPAYAHIHERVDADWDKYQKTLLAFARCFYFGE